MESWSNGMWITCGGLFSPNSPTIRCWYAEIPAKDGIFCTSHCTAVCCSALQCVAVCCSVLQCVVMLQIYPAAHCAAVYCSVLQCIAVCCMLQENYLGALVSVCLHRFEYGNCMHAQRWTNKTRIEKENEDGTADTHKDIRGMTRLEMIPWDTARDGISVDKPRDVISVDTPRDVWIGHGSRYDMRKITADTHKTKRAIVETPRNIWIRRETYGYGSCRHA